MMAQPSVERSTRNPYVGPRPLRDYDGLFGRDREAQALTDLLIAERVVLLHAPSGAGKTSLIQAGVIKRLNSEGFRVSGPLRLNGVRPDDASIANRYLWSAVDGLLGNGHAAGAKDATSLDEGLATVEQSFENDDHVIILDQFEEILTLDPADWASQEEFFRALGHALERQNRWALLSMREDYMGGLARYVGLLPTRLDVRFRLDFLEHDAARLAMRGPAASQGVTFTEEAIELLISDLSAIRVQDPMKGQTIVTGPYVEPVQLQVVCETLWRRLERKFDGGFSSIDVQDVRDLSDLDRALGSFYEEVIDDVARTTGASERSLRQWFGSELITESGFRSQTSVGPEHPGIDPNVVLRALEDRYLIRSDERNATRWYELSHDRLVYPVQINNAAWRARNASTWELRAYDWERSNHSERHLLRGDEIRLARQWLSEHDEAAEAVAAYVDASKQAWMQESLRQRISTAIAVLSIALMLETVIIVALLSSR